MKLNTNRMIELASEHAQWFSATVKPLLATFFEHGYKHGWKEALNQKITKKVEDDSIYLVIYPDNDGCGDIILATCSSHEKATKILDWFYERTKNRRSAYITKRSLDNHPVLRTEACSG